MTASNTYGRQIVLPLTNKSGGGVIAGDVVILDTTNNDAFTTTTSAAVTLPVGVAQETIASNGVGRVAFGGYIPLVNVNASVTRGHYGATHTVAKQAADAGAARTAGTFCEFLTGGTTPDAMLFNPDLGSGGSTIITKDEGSTLSSSVTTLDFIGAGVTASGGGATTTVTIPGGITPGQTISYPSTFTGDTIDGSSTTPFVDVAAFDTKEVLNSRVLHLQTKGASKDQKVRVTLGTTKAAAFDVRVALAFAGFPWSGADNNTYADLMLTTAAGAAQIAVCRLQTWPMDSTMSTPTIYVPMIQTKFGGSAVAAQADNLAPMVQIGQVVTVRFVRDGSNVIKFYSAPGLAPLALSNIRIRSNYEPYTQTVSGTLACIEFAIHTPTGPGAAVEYDLWVDYLQSV